MITMALLLTSIVLSTMTVAPTATDPPPDQVHARRMREIRQIRMETLLQRLQPSPLSKERLESIATRIEMDEETLENWAYLTQQFQSDWERLSGEDDARVSDLRTAAYDWDGRLLRFEPRPVPELVELELTSARIRRVIGELESDLLDGLPMMAAKPHVETARSIVFRREFERDWRPSSIPGSTNDLTRLLDDMELDGELSESIAARFREYRRETLQARALHAELFDRNRRFTAEEVLELGPSPEHALEPAISRRIGDDRTGRAGEILEQEFRLRAINQKYVSEFGSMLPPEHSERLRERWERLLGGTHIEEQDLLQSLVEKIARDAPLEPRDREAVLSVPGEIRSGNAFIDARMMQKRNELETIREEPGTPERDARLLAAQAGLLELQVARRRRVLAGIQTLAGILSSDAPETSKLLFQMEARLKARSKSDQDLATRASKRSSDMTSILEAEEEERRIKEASKLREEELRRETGMEDEPDPTESDANVENPSR
jgi:hypothetical protein